MTTLSQQLLVFGLTVALGILIGVLFDFYRMLNRVIRPSSWLTQVGDLLFWLLLSGMVFWLLLIGNWGEVRAYVFLGLALGLIGHLRWFSKTTLRFWNWLFRLTGKVYGCFISIIGWPVRLFSRIVVVPIGWLSMGLRWLFSPFLSVMDRGKNIIKRLALRK